MKSATIFAPFFAMIALNIAVWVYMYARRIAVSAPLRAPQGFIEGTIKMPTLECREYLALTVRGVRRAAFGVVLIVYLSARAGEPTAGMTQITRFDGLWQTTLSCANANGALGYSFRFASIIKNGVLHGEKGTAHEAGWLQIDGSVPPDGVADLYVEGLVGAAPFAVGQRPAGTSYGYHVEARFSRDRAEGHRVEGRPCTVVWTREK